MCDPLTIAVAGLAVSAAGVGVNYAGQQKAKKANDKAAKEAMAQGLSDLSAQGAEERVAALAAENQASRQVGSAAALARVGSAEAGITGASVQAQQNDLQRQLGEFNSGTEANLNLNLQQIQRERLGQIALGTSRQNAVAAPNPFLAGLQILGQGLNTAGSLYAYNHPPQAGG